VCEGEFAFSEDMWGCGAHGRAAGSFEASWDLCCG
jgi:hypothetical protein